MAIGIDSYPIFIKELDINKLLRGSNAGIMNFLVQIML